MNAGDKVTLIYVDDVMALSHRIEVTVQSADDSRITFKQKGKRSAYVRKLNKETLILPGWDLYPRVDTECRSCFCGNACINLVGEPEALKAAIETNLNPNFSRKDIILVWPRESAGYDDGVPLYLDEAANSTHSGVRTLVERYSG